MSESQTAPHSQEVAEVLLPSMGEGIAEATLVKWLKKPGDVVKKDDPLLEVSTDKVDTEIPSPASGTLLETVAKEGSTVSVNATIAWIGPKGASIPQSSKQIGPDSVPSKTDAKSSAKGTQPAKPPSAAKSTARRTVNASAKVFEGLPVFQRTSPLVRKMAKDLGIDLKRVAVPGSGLHGRVTKEDLEAFAESPAAYADAYQSPQPVVEPLLRPSRVTPVTQNGIETLEGVPVRREKMGKMRRLIAEHMVESVRISPHVTTTFEIDLHKVVAMREAHKAAFAAKEGFNLTFTPILIKAAVEAIKKHPVVNVSVDGEDVLWKDQINMGCAVALGTEGGGGLIVPVIKNAQSMSMTEIARKLNDLATRARAKKLAADEVVGGTFSVTNPGGWGSIFSSPIINQPQVAMLGIGAIVKRPVVIANDQIAIRPMMMASLTFDHRVIDGEGGAMWLATYKKILEEWSETP